MSIIHRFKKLDYCRFLVRPTCTSRQCHTYDVVVARAPYHFRDTIHVIQQKEICRSITEVHGSTVVTHKSEHGISAAAVVIDRTKAEGRIFSVFGNRPRVPIVSARRVSRPVSVFADTGVINFEAHTAPNPVMLLLPGATTRGRCEQILHTKNANTCCRHSNLHISEQRPHNAFI